MWAGMKSPFILYISIPVSGLVLTGAAGSVVTIPTSVLLLGKGLLLKKLLIKKGLEKDIIISFMQLPMNFQLCWPESSSLRRITREFRRDMVEVIDMLDFHTICVTHTCNKYL